MTLAPTLLDLPNLSTSWMGKPSFHFSEVTSTQDILKTMYQNHASHGTMVITDHQQTGRGRSGKTWISLPGSQLLFSVLLFPKIPSHQIPILNIAAAVSWVRILEKQGLSDVQIKWPNDVLVQNKKIAGILAERISSSKNSQSAIALGIGLNVNVQLDDFPEELKFSATSFSQHSSIQNPLELLSDFLKEFEMEYETIHQQGSCKTQAFFRSHWIYSAQPISIWTGQTYSGRSWDIDSDGALLLEESNQKISRILSGSVTLLSDVTGKV